VCVAALAAVLVVTGCASTTAVPTPTPTAALPALPTEGYLVADTAQIGSLDRDEHALSTVGIDGVTLAAAGDTVSELPDNAAALVTVAHAKGLSAELLVSNYDNSRSAFSPKIAAALLDSASHRAAVTTQLVAQVSAAGFDGVQIDFESLTGADSEGLTAFAQQLHDALGAPRTVSMAVTAEGSSARYLAAGYDFAQLRNSLARVVLMAYDQHGPTWSKPGPVGGLPWATVSLDALISTGLPTAQIDLGVAGYGYSWPGNGTDGAQLSDEDSRTLAGDLAHYDPTQAEWTATLPDDTVVWWSDARSLDRRRALALSRNLHGIAVWQLSLTDPL
jgi:spore germination protein